MKNPRNKPAILRVWGYVLERRKPDPPRTDIDYSVHLQGHGDADTLNLSQPGWFESRPRVSYPAPDIHEVKRHTRLRLDRLSRHDDWKPIIRVVDCEVWPGCWEPICFCILNYTSQDSKYEKNGRELRDDEEWNVPVSTMVQAFGRYLQGYLGSQAGMVERAVCFSLPSVAPLLSDSARISVQGFLRGRQRRKMRRHGMKASKTEPELNSARVRKISHDTSTETSPVGDRVLRGRLRRRQRRTRIIGLPSSPSADHSMRDARGRTQTEPKATPINITHILANMPGRSLTVDDYQLLAKMPILWAGPGSNNESNLLVIAIDHEGDGHRVGHLILPKESRGTDRSWKKPPQSSGETFDGIHKFLTLGSAERCPAPGAYWSKFLMRAHREFRSWSLSGRGIDDMDLTMAVSFRNPLLVFPDCVPGPVAGKRQFLQTYLALDSSDTWIDGSVGSDTARMLMWLPTSRVKNTDNDSEYWIPSAPPDLPEDTHVDDKLFIESEYRFAFAYAGELETYLYGDVEMINGREYPSIIGNTGIYSELFFLTREIFYGARYLSHAPQRHQERIARRIQKIATGSGHSPDVRAHATLEYGLCLLSGFGFGPDIKTGLEWVARAARGGSRKARAVVWRLHESYGQDHPNKLGDDEWLVREARYGSYWAFAELADKDNESYRQILKDAVFHRPDEEEDEEDRPGHFHTMVEIHKRFNMHDHVELREQIRTERAKLESELTTRIAASAMRWASCYGSAEVMRVLHEAQKQGHPHMNTGKHIRLALGAGRADVALALLEGGASIEETPYLLFQLHHLPSRHVEAVARILLNRGCDVNEKVDLHSGQVFKRDRLSIFCDRFRGSNTPSPNNCFRHWMPEIGGNSLTPLRWAIFNENDHLVKVLLDLGAEFPRMPDVETCAANPGGLGGLPAEAFTVAVLDEPCFRVEILKLFFKRHGNQLGRTVFAETPLGLIAMEPDSPERRLRLGRQNSPENMHSVLSLLRKYQPESDTQLFWAAAMNGHLDIIHHLVREGVDIESRHNGQTPLHTAVLHGQKAVFEFLLKKGADVRALTSDKRMSMMHLLFWKPKPLNVEMFMLLELQQRMGVYHCDMDTFGSRIQPIHLAVLNNRLQAVEKLIQFGADPHSPIEEDVMPSMRGAIHAHWPADHLQYLNMMDDQDMDDVEPALVSIKGLTPIGIVLARHDMFSTKDVQKILDLLVPSPASMRSLYTRPGTKQTVFHLIACHDWLMKSDIFELLSERCKGSLNIDPANIRDADGDTPLHYAALLGGSHWHGRSPGLSRSGSISMSCVTRLIGLGAKPRLRNVHGITPGTIIVWANIWQGQKTLEGDDVPDVRQEIQLRPAGLSQEYGSDGDTSSCASLRDAGGDSGDPRVVRFMSQLLRGADVVDIQDLHDDKRSVLSPKTAVNLRLVNDWGTSRKL